MKQRSLTHEFILLLNAGPSLDDLVAEYVMGWKDINPVASKPYWQAGNTSVLKEDWTPSVHPGQAWLVVEKLSEWPTPWLIRISNRASADGITWEVECAGVMSEGAFPLAACRAALHAVAMEQLSLDEDTA